MVKYLENLIFWKTNCIDKVWKELHNNYKLDTENQKYVDYKDKIKEEYDQLISSDENFNIELEKEILKYKINKEKSNLEGTFSSLVVTIAITGGVNLCLNNYFRIKFKEPEDINSFLIDAGILLFLIIIIIVVFARKVDKDVYKEKIIKGYYGLRFKVLEEIEEELKNIGHFTYLKKRNTIKKFISNESTIEDLERLEELIKERRKQL